MPRGDGSVEEMEKWRHGCVECLVCSAGNVSLCRRYGDCRLTPRDKVIMAAMFVGEWRCETCGLADGCTVAWGGPCQRWVAGHGSQRSLERPEEEKEE